MLAGIAAALVSHPADTILSKINQSSRKEESSPLISDTLVYSVHDKNHKNVNSNTIITNTNSKNSNSFTAATTPYPSTLVHRKGEKNMDECEAIDFAHKPILYNDNDTIIHKVNTDVEHNAHANNNNDNIDYKINNTNYCEDHNHLCTESTHDNYNNAVLNNNDTILMDDKLSISSIDNFGHTISKNTNDKNSNSVVNIINTNTASYSDKCEAKRLTHKKRGNNALWQIVVV